MRHRNQAAFLTFCVGFVLTILWAPLVASADTRCKSDDTLAICYEVYFPSDETATTPAEETKAEEEKIASATVKADAALKDIVAGAEAAGTGAGTNTRDFLSLLNLFGQLNTGDKDQDGNVTIDLNHLLPKEVLGLGGQLQGVLNTAPVLFEPIKSALPEEGRDELVKKLDEKAKSLSDYSLTFSITLANQKVGRDLQPWKKEYAALFREALDRAAKPEPGTTLAAAMRRISVGDASEDGDEEETFYDLAKAKLGITTEKAGDGARIRDEAELLRTVFEQGLEQEEAYEGRIDAASKDLQLDAFPTLLSNQPQLFFSAKKRFRDELVGPEETSFKLTWEQPMAPNLNRMRKQVRDGEGFGDAFASFVKENQEALKASHRLSLAIEYLKVDDLPVELPDEEFSKLFEGGHKLIGTLGWGRQLETADDGTAISKLDVLFSYEDVEDPNPDLRVDSRFLVTVTLTRKIGGVDVPFAIVYANKSEFLAEEDLDEQLSAHVGLKWTFDTDPKGK